LIPIACAVAALVAPHMARADPPDTSHLRFVTPRGAVHVWTPPSYDRDSARIVVYLHGFYVDVDHAWRDHMLAAQFERSGLNAVFVACAAPSGPKDPITFTSLESLLARVGQRMGGLPTGEVIVVAHSGAHWMLRSWLGKDRIDSVVLLDAIYGELPQLREWLDASVEHRLVDVAELTRPWADEFHASLSKTSVVTELPSSDAAWREATKDSSIVYVHSNIGHMKLVTGGRVIPMILGSLGSRASSDHAE
jgi:hypothetical protein